MNKAYPHLSLLLSLLCCISVCQAQPAMAHPAIDNRLKQVNAQLAKRPNDAELLVTRGNLYLEHGEAGKALQDLTLATQREPTLSEAWFSRARTELQMGQLDEALASNTSLLKLYAQAPTSPAVVGGLFQQGEIYLATGKPDAAAASYQQALALDKHASPEHHLQLIDALQKSHQPDAAIKAIEDAIQVHGELPQLLELALAIESGRQQPAAALQWLNRLLQQPQRQEYLLLRKARLQREMRNEAAAQASLDAALQAIEALPKTRRYSEATLMLEKEIEAEKTAAGLEPTQPTPATGLPQK